MSAGAEPRPTGRVPRGSGGESISRAIPLAALAFLLLYLFGTSRIFSYADDSLPYAAQVVFGSKPVVHHLILSGFHAAARAFGFAERGDFLSVLAVLEAYVAFTGALALALVGVLGARWFGSTRAAVFAMLSVGFSYGFWAYSIVPDLYIPAAAFVLLAVYWADTSPRAPASAVFVRLTLAALAVLLAALHHQSHAVAALPIACVLLVARRRELAFGVRALRAASFLGLTAGIGFLTFYSVYASSSPEAKFTDWVRGYSAWMNMLPYDRAQLLTPVYALVGIVRAIVFPEFALRFDGAYASVQDHFRLKLLLDERFLLQSFPPAAIPFLLAASAIAVALFGAGVLRGLRESIRRPPEAPGFWMLAAWIPVQAALFALWEASSNEFWIWLLPGLGLIGVALPLARCASKGAGRFAAVGVACLALANGAIVSRYWSERNCFYRVNKEFLSTLRAADLVVGAYTYSGSKLAYLMPVVVPIREFLLGSFTMDDAELAGHLDRVEKSGGRIFIEPGLALPYPAENGLMQYQTRMTRADVEAELLELEELARARGIPVYAVVRTTRGTVALDRPEFRGTVRWIERSEAAGAPAAEAPAADAPAAKGSATGG